MLQFYETFIYYLHKWYVKVYVSETSMIYCVNITIIPIVNVSLYNIVMWHLLGKSGHRNLNEMWQTHKWYV